MATASEWLSGARPRTLPAAAAPVLVGTAAAEFHSEAHLGAALLALGVALSLQIGVNFANDYSDGVRGTDLDRVGPTRLVASGATSARSVKFMAFAWLGLGALFGLALITVSGIWWLLAVGVAAVLAAWYYTGGRNPYGYRGLGEVGVFVFFGLVAVLGTMYTQVHAVSFAGVLGAVAIGLLACALLMVNNIRDIATDFTAGKRTLAVRLGERRARRAFVAMLWLPLLIAVAAAPLTSGWSLISLVLLAPAVVLSIPVMAGAWGRALILVLGGTGIYELAYAALFSLGLLLAA
ncbi:1,4-dihydroxy-2-naphthoate polyprenyltransferase [Rarobacter faecitabidus]|uniref:1,4-dihydroxy-2-naphthoate octaprenyltransferase n=1 Tax=Rarobacter faecitabidus TaxID=13243 RepID=A0A542ZUB9_RARFA|nr:1,4-dihydroxy-2-naphthoate polyprenyltransferase [Rarobacter faecitabidus]TQL63790.1 1,4-dihydroxy-2-naphthoate prenyltransferase [Rarobacter faecitabidus]